MAASLARARRAPELEPIQVLRDHYARVADEKFEGVIPRDFRIEFNPHLRRLTGRITYAERLIELSEYHFIRYGLKDALATLEHELLHLYLHTLGLPSGHNKHFKRLAAKKSIRVYHANPYPRNRVSPYRLLYECPRCERMVFRVRQVNRALACGICCRTHANGRWDSRFALVFVLRVKMA